MYYLKCKHCNHLNEIKSEYLVVCGLCSRKLENNFKNWHIRNPNKTFDDYKRETCLTGENHHPNPLPKSSRKKNRNGTIAGLIGGILGLTLLILLTTHFMKHPGIQNNDTETPISEQQWYTATYSGGASISTPVALTPLNSLTREIPESIKNLIKTMEGHTYKERGIDFTFIFTEYTPEVGQIDLDKAADAGLARMKKQRGIFDFKNEKAYFQQNELDGIVIQGTYMKGNTEHEYNITIYKEGVKLYQLLCSNKKGDDTARGIVRRVYNTFKILGHEPQKQNENERQ